MKNKIYILILLLLVSISVNAEGEATIKNIKVNNTECVCAGYDCNIEVESDAATITYELNDDKATVDRLSGFKIDLLSEVTTVKLNVSNEVDGEKIENTYNISITKREKQNDFSLKSLSVNGEKIDILKDVVVYSYTSKYDIEKITIDAVANDSKAKIIKEKEYAFPLTESSLAIDFSVKAEDGKSESYRVVVTRDVKPDTNLKSLKIEPGTINFNEKTYEYKVNVEYSVNEIKIDAIPSNKNAKVEIDNNPLVVGENEIKITVTSDKSKSEYVLFVTREENIDKSIANLKSIKVQEYPRLDFKENVLDYILSFSKIPETLHIETKSKEDSNTVITGNEHLVNGSKIIIKNTLVDSNISREYTLEIKEQKKIHDNKNVILISIVVLLIVMIILFILEIHGKKKEKRKYLNKIFELRHKVERKRKEEKEKKVRKKIKEDEIEII